MVTRLFLAMVILFPRLQYQLRATGFVVKVVIIAVCGAFITGLVLAYVVYMHQFN